MKKLIFLLSLCAGYATAENEGDYIKNIVKDVRENQKISLKKFIRQELKKALQEPLALTPQQEKELQNYYRTLRAQDKEKMQRNPFVVNINLLKNVFPTHFAQTLKQKITSYAARKKIPGSLTIAIEPISIGRTPFLIKDKNNIYVLGTPYDVRAQLIPLSPLIQLLEYVASKKLHIEEVGAQLEKKFAKDQVKAWRDAARISVPLYVASENAEQAKLFKKFYHSLAQAKEDNIKIVAQEVYARTDLVEKLLIAEQEWFKTPTADAMYGSVAYEKMRDKWCEEQDKKGAPSTRPSK